MPLSQGQVLQGRYVTQTLLGQGGMGSVFRSFDQSLNRAVAIKEHTPDPNASPQGLAQARVQFKREAQVLANLSHPNLPRVTDYFSFGGNEYLVMDLIEGQSLSEIASQHGAVTEGAVRAWMNQVLDALIFLHSQTPPIIHRDVKPSNIILKADAKVVLVDFGLVKLLDVYNPSTLTAMHALGTPEYAPIEQFSAGMHTDARSDIYSLGATMYQLLSGTLPLDVPHRMVDPNAMQPLRAIKPTISPRTEAVVKQALEIQPSSRFLSAAQMKQALNGLKILGAPSGTPPHASLANAAQLAIRRLAGTIRNNRWALAAVLGICAIGFGWSMLPVIKSVLTPSVASPLIPTPQISPTPMPKIPTLSSVSFIFPTPSLTPTVTSTPTPSLTATSPIIFNFGTRLPTQTAAPTSTPTPLPPPLSTPTPILLVPPQRYGKDNAEMVLVPEGQFTMGWDDYRADARPAHQVNLDSYWIDRYEVTNGLYAKCVAEGKCQPPNQWSSQTRSAYFNTTQYENFPVIHVSWNDANAYCAWAGKRLPTEAEWEKAARGADRRLVPWGNSFDQTKINSLESSRGDTTVVDYFLSGASPFGAQDMAGNVWEWTADWYDQAYYSNSPRDNPKGPTAGDKKVLRGGSWLDVRENVLTFNRHSAPPLSGSAFVGFRCALDASTADKTRTPIRVTATPLPTLTPTLTRTPTATATATPGIGARQVSPIDGAWMVAVPGGDFMMGSNGGADSEKPAHPVLLDAFWIDQYEVTNALYKKCVDVGKCQPPSNWGSRTRNSYYGNPQYNLYPVIYVSWNAATAYCDWTGKRLPTEAEWEKAARGTDGRIYPWGNDWDVLKTRRLNFSDKNDPTGPSDFASDDGYGDTAPVGTYPSGGSVYGAMDMAGNVWEWVGDWYDSNFYKILPQINPRGPSSGQFRVFRGGSWYHGQGSAQAFSRGADSPEGASNYRGFRCAQ